MCTPKLSEGPGAEVVVVTKGCAPALSAVGCAMYHACSWKGDLVAGGGGADGAAVSIHLWPHLWGCEIAGSGSAAAHTHAWAFWAADHVLGAACLPELALPLYGSGCCKQDCLQLSSPMHCVAGGSGDKAAAACGHFCQVTPICLVVSVMSAGWVQFAPCLEAGFPKNKRCKQQQTNVPQPCGGYGRCPETRVCHH
jgi:hypothetical protein